MNKFLSIAAMCAILSSSLLVGAAAMAATNGSVTATVSPVVVSVSLTNNTFDWGALELKPGLNNATTNSYVSTIGNVNSPAIFTNDGSVAVNVSVKVNNSTNATTGWAYTNTEYENGLDIFNYQVIPVPDGTTRDSIGSNYSPPMNTFGDIPAMNNVTVGQSWLQDFNLLMPAESSSLTTQTIVVEYLAVQVN